MDERKSPTTQGNAPGAQGSGSDTVSAAKISAGTSVGTAGQPPKPQEHASQGSTLASHTSKPLGGGAGATGAGSTGVGTGGAGSIGAGSAGMGTSAGSMGTTGGMGQGNQTQSRGPEHLRHQDKDAGQGLGQHGRSGAGQGTTGQSASGGAASHVQERASDLYEQATERAGELYEQASEWAQDAYEQGSRYFRQGGRSMQGMSSGSVGRFVRENPVLVGVVGLAAGLLLGALLPRTRREDETLGRWSDELREQGMRYARDMTQRGREFVEEAFADGDPRFASHESEWRPGDEGGHRSGPSGRFQNH